MPRLIIHTPDSEEATYPLQDSADQPKEMTIGRNETCDIIISDSSVSGYHAKIESTPHGFILRDVGSTNGLIIDNRREESIPLVSGVSIKLGEATMIFQEDPAENSEEEAASPPVQDITIDPPKPLEYDGDSDDDDNDEPKTLHIFKKGYYLTILLYSILVFALAFAAGVIYKHYALTKEILPYQWLGIESPRAKDLDVLKQQQEEVDRLQAVEEE